MAFEEVKLAASPPFPAGPATEPAPVILSESKQSIVGTLVRLAVSLAAIGVVLFAVDYKTAFSEISHENIALMILSVPLALIQLFLGAVRWHTVRTGLGIKVPLSDTLRIFSIGSFMGSYVISGISGDLMRGWLSYQNGIDLPRATNSVIIDRVLILFSVAVLLLLVAPWFLVKFGYGIEGWAPTLMSAGFCVAALCATQLHRLPQAWLTFAPFKILHSLGNAMNDTLMRPSVAAAGVLTGMASQVLNATAMYSLALALHIPMSFIDALVVSQIVAVTGAIPISVGGWGVRELTVVGVLSTIGVDPAKALLLSVQFGICNLVINLPGGFVWLAMKRKSARLVQAGAGQVSPL